MNMLHFLTVNGHEMLCDDDYFKIIDMLYMYNFFKSSIPDYENMSEDMKKARGEKLRIAVNERKAEIKAIEKSLLSVNEPYRSAIKERIVGNGKSGKDFETLTWRELADKYMLDFSALQRNYEDFVYLVGLNMGMRNKGV